MLDGLMGRRGNIKKASWLPDTDDKDDDDMFEQSSLVGLRRTGGLAKLVLISAALRFFEETMDDLPRSPAFCFPELILG